jgi:hypothetical protein
MATRCCCPPDKGGDIAVFHLGHIDDFKGMRHFFIDFFGGKMAHLGDHFSPMPILDTRVGTFSSFKPNAMLS